MSSEGESTRFDDPEPEPDPTIGGRTRTRTKSAALINYSSNLKRRGEMEYLACSEEQFSGEEICAGTWRAGRY